MTLPERPVMSPCVNICALDEQDICTGCQRTVGEITRWSRMDNDERRQVLRSRVAGSLGAASTPALNSQAPNSKAIRKGTSPLQNPAAL